MGVNAIVTTWIDGSSDCGFECSLVVDHTGLLEASKFRKLSGEFGFMRDLKFFGALLMKVSALYEGHHAD